MKPNAYLTHHELLAIELRARRMRAEALAQAFDAIGTWLRRHLGGAAPRKA